MTQDYIPATTGGIGTAAWDGTQDYEFTLTTPDKPGITGSITAAKDGKTYSIPVTISYPVEAVYATASQTPEGCLGTESVNIPYGKGENDLDPKGDATRAQVAQLLMAFDQLDL